MLHALMLMQLGELELLVPPPPSSAAVVAFALKFLAGYNNTLQSGNRASASADAAVLASFGAEPQRDKALGMHRLVSTAWATGVGHFGGLACTVGATSPQPHLRGYVRCFEASPGDGIHASV